MNKYKVTVGYHWTSNRTSDMDKPEKIAMVETIEADFMIPDMTEHGYLKLYRYTDAGEDLVAMFATWESVILLPKEHKNLVDDDLVIKGRALPGSRPPAGDGNMVRSM